MHALDVDAIRAEFGRRGITPGPRYLDIDAVSRALAEDGVAAGLFGALLQQIAEVDQAKREGREPVMTAEVAGVVNSVRERDERVRNASTSCPPPSA